MRLHVRNSNVVFIKCSGSFNIEFIEFHGITSVYFTYQLAESARDMTQEAIAKYNDAINKKIFEMFTAADSNEKLGGIAALST